MSSDEIELLKVRMAGRNDLVKSVFTGVKDILVAALVIYSAITQQANAGKIDLTAQAAATSAVINTKWQAERTGKPEDISRAKEAETKLDAIASKISEPKDRAN